MSDLSDADAHALITLLSLPAAGPRRLRALLSGASPTEVVAALRRRERLSGLTGVTDVSDISIAPAVWTTWFDRVAAVADSVDVDAHRSDGAQILHPAHPLWPFSDDPDPPILLFTRGDTGLLSASPALGVVGTRRCTSAGRSVADEIGSEAATAGIAVVSGLALGVDAAAHRGVMAVGGPAIGVVACGLDTVYPASNRGLWEAIATSGLLISEVPLGHRPTRWRFPARNRMIAALSDLVVVVESHANGGALSTVDEATERSIPVAVVPGSVRSPASDGTNALLMDGATPVRHGADVLDLLGVDRLANRSAASRELDAVQLALPSMPPVAGPIVDAVAAGAVHLDRLIELTGTSPAELAVALDQLEHAGVIQVRGHVVSPATFREGRT